jgi:asparagine synthase (glutamine-hydrolysing)
VLKARIYLSDLHAPVRVAGGSIVFGDSRLTPFAHRLLRAKLVRAPSFTALVIYERLIDEAPSEEIEEEVRPFETPSEVAAAMASYPLDWLAVTLAHGSVELSCGYQGTVPVYVALRDGVLDISWHIADLIPDGPIALRPSILARFVMSRWPYAVETMLDGVYRLTSEARIAITNEAVRYEYPTPNPVVGRHALRPNADPIAQFFDAIAVVLALRPLEPDKTACELSGGMDSAIATLAARRVLGAPFLSYGGEFEGEMGAAQRARRQLVSSVAGTRDIAVPAEYFAPYDEGGPRRKPLGVWPEDDSYPELLFACYKLISGAGIDTVISGLGGDELYPVFAHEEGYEAGIVAPPGSFVTERCAALASLPCAAHPQSWLLTSCWLSSSARASGYLRAGLWPIHPFFSREVTRFTFNLPVEWRLNRALHRRVLTRLLNNPVYEKYVEETFYPVMHAGFRRNAGFVQDLIANSALAKLGFVDTSKIAVKNKRALDAEFFFLNFECFFRGREIYTPG